MGGGLLLSVDMENIFDEAFCNVTKKLVNLELQRISGEEDEISFDEGYREAIATHGYLSAKIICWFSDELFHYITDMMNGGKTPSDEEIPLFLNEYINITCGYAVSKLNDLVGRSSRLSVPAFFQGTEKMGEKWEIQEGGSLLYHTEIGKLYILVKYSFQSEQEEVV